MSIEGDMFKAKQPPNVQPIVAEIRCGGKGEPKKGCPCRFCELAHGEAKDS